MFDGELKDYPVDLKIIKAMEKALSKGELNYTENAGLPELRRTVAEAQKIQDGFDYKQENVIITIGVQNALYSTINTLSKLGAKRVLIPKINFGFYKKVPKEFDLDIETYPLNKDFGIDTNKLEEILDPEDILILNSPANPTGRVFTKDEQEGLGDLFNRKLKQGYVLSDEVYEKFVYDGENPGSFSKYFDRTIVLNGISKSGASAGLRVGWAITRNETLAQAITSNNAPTIGCPPTPNQFTAIPVVRGETQDSINKYNSSLKKNRDYAMEVLDDLSIPYITPKGSFYIFPDLKEIVGDDTKQFCLDTAKKEKGVVVIPGIAFGSPSNIRISLATSQIKEGMDRFKNAIKEYN